MRFRFLQDLTKITRGGVIYITDVESLHMLKYGALPYSASVSGVAFSNIRKCYLNLQEDIITMPIKSKCLSVEIKDDTVNKYGKLLNMDFLDSLDGYGATENSIAAGIQYKLPEGNIVVYIGFSRYDNDLFDMNVRFFQINSNMDIVVAENTTDYFDTDDIFAVDEKQKEIYRFTGVNFEKCEISKNIYSFLNYNKIFKDLDREKYNNKPSLVICIDNDRNGVPCPLVIGKTYIRKNVHQCDNEWYADIYDIGDTAHHVGVFKINRFKLCEEN